MRAERLVALLFTLQSRRSATVPELAAALGVSERTMHRDLAALQTAGVPLWTETGRYGGVRLVEGWRTRLDGLTSREAVAIFAMGVPRALAELGLGTAVSAAHAKVSATLPAPCASRPSTSRSGSTSTRPAGSGPRRTPGTSRPSPGRCGSSGAPPSPTGATTARSSGCSNRWVSCSRPASGTWSRAPKGQRGPTASAASAASSSATSGSSGPRTSTSRTGGSARPRSSSGRCTGTGSGCG